MGTAGVEQIRNADASRGPERPSLLKRDLPILLAGALYAVVEFVFNFDLPIVGVALVILLAWRFRRERRGLSRQTGGGRPAPPWPRCA